MTPVNPFNGLALGCLSPSCARLARIPSHLAPQVENLSNPYVMYLSKLILLSPCLVRFRSYIILHIVEEYCVF